MPTDAGAPTLGSASTSTTTPPDDATLLDLRRFYDLLAELQDRLGGFAHLRDGLPSAMVGASGVYVFFEEGERRTGSGTGPRVVRIGTHGLTVGSKSTLRSRLANHRGTAEGGNQRTSIFRRHVGAALMDAGRLPAVPDWWTGSTASLAQREAERQAEAMVSLHIGAMPYLWLRIDDAAGRESGRGFIERNAIALLSSPAARRLDPPSPGWLGRHARAPEVRESGLWNVRHIGDALEPGFLDRLALYVRGMG